jgi:hypothetical protein
MADTDITITLTRTEALALVKLADVGLRVVEALSLVQSTVAAEKAIRKLEAATKG